MLVLIFLVLLLIAGMLGLFLLAGLAGVLFSPAGMKATAAACAVTFAFLVVMWWALCYGI